MDWWRTKANDAVFSPAAFQAGIEALKRGGGKPTSLRESMIVTDREMYHWLKGELPSLDFVIGPATPKDIEDNAEFIAYYELGPNR